MDTQTFVVEQAQVSADFEPMSFSWDAIKSDPVVRLALLKEARKMVGAEKLIPALYDHLRAIAASTPAEQEGMQEALGDMLAAMGMEMVAPLPELTVPVPTLSDVEMQSLDLCPSSPASLTSKPEQGFAGPRPTPQFSTPSAVQAPASPAESKSASSTDDPKRQFVEDMKVQLSGAHGPAIPAVSPLRTAPQRMPDADPYREPVDGLSPSVVGEAQSLGAFPPPVSSPEESAMISAEVPMNERADEQARAEEVVSTGASEMSAPGESPAPQEAVPAQPSAEVSATLMNPDVTKGLEKLLSEWDLFKSSGIFGLGAGGTEHPLYKKIAALPIMSVVSGRWEGTDTKAVTNIKEYMDGWRQQWGIDADPEESFETYLRRVIADILHVAPASASEPVAVAA